MEHGLVLKCSFGEQRIHYLGHVIADGVVAMDTDKVSAVQAWPRPRSVKALRGFLGLTGYYRRFINNYGIIAAPLTALLKRKAFLWSSAATEAFDALKQALTTAPVLQLPDFDKPFIIDCDASGTGFGAVLHQGRASLEAVSLDEGVYRPDGSLQPQASLGPASGHHSTAYMGKQAIWLQLSG